MVNVVEVVLELRADGFINSGRVTAGRVVHATKPGLFTCQVEATVKGVPLPDGTYGQVDEARAALLDFWAKCNKALENYPYWIELDYK